MEFRDLYQKEIEKNLGSLCKDIAFPFGSKEDYNEEIIDIAIKKGYKKCFLNIHGYNYFNKRRKSEKRIIIYPGKDLKFLVS